MIPLASIDDYAAALNDPRFNISGGGLIEQTLGGMIAEPIPPDYSGYARGAFKQNGVIFSCMLARQLVFSAVRFQYQRLNRGKPSELFGTQDLMLLEQPWPGGTTQDLLNRMEQDASLSGNSYWTPSGGELVRLRPDWVQIVLEPRLVPGMPSGDLVMDRDGRIVRPDAILGWRKLGYAYCEGGFGSGNEAAYLPAGQVAHYAPIPDPQATYRGMSWITPLIREVQADQVMTRHRVKFFENGAPQPLDARVLTATGWSTMGEMRPGERVIGADGKPHEVLAVYPQGERQTYRVRFTDGSVVRCTADHLWSVTRYHGTTSERTDTMSLADIMAAGLRYQSGAPRWAIPYVDPVEYDGGGHLPLHPYLLGSLLGDGCLGLKSVSLAAHTDDADEQQRILTPLLPDGVQMIRRDRGGNSTEWNLRGTGNVNLLMRALRLLDLDGSHGYDKAIPDAYMRGSVTDRVALLAGLMDTDGSAEGPAARFTTTSETLARQVADLALSLGGRATVMAKALREGRQQWGVNVSRLPEWIVPFRLTRKAAHYTPAKRVARYRHIDSVTADTVEPCQCIAVDSADHLYVTDGYVLTHNTPNLIIRHPATASPESVRKFMQMVEDNHAGTENAYRTLHLGGGADVTVAGANLRQIEFSTVQGHGETRIAAAAGVPPVIVGLSEGLQAATYSNYAQARRRFADGTMHPLWQNAAGSMQPLMPRTPPGVRLWYDARDVPFLREDEKDAATIQETQARTIRTLVDGGYTPESVQSAVLAGDFGLLVHSGLMSVQLQKPGSSTPDPAPSAAVPAPAADGEDPTAAAEA